MRWLHRLLDDSYQLPAQVIQVHPIAECCVEGCQHPGGVMLAPINDLVALLLNVSA
jgi:hypothetical protein